MSDAVFHIVRIFAALKKETEYASNLSYFFKTQLAMDEDMYDNNKIIMMHNNLAIGRQSAVSYRESLAVLLHQQTEEPFILEDVRNAIRNDKSRKAAGSDKIILTV